MLLAEFLKLLGMTMRELALKLRVLANRIGQIVEGKRTVSPDTALRPGRYFGTGPEFWTNPQARYDLETAKGALADAIEREVLPRQQRETERA